MPTLVAPQTYLVSRRCLSLMPQFPNCQGQFLITHQRLCSKRRGSSFKLRKTA